VRQKEASLASSRAVHSRPCRSYSAADRTGISRRLWLPRGAPEFDALPRHSAFVCYRCAGGWIFGKLAPGFLAAGPVSSANDRRDFTAGPGSGACEES
jgi:hypothetical protein